MTKQDFIKKWIGWVSYTNREKLTNEMEADLGLVSQALRIHDVVAQIQKMEADKAELLESLETILKENMSWYDLHTGIKYLIQKHKQ